MIILNARSLCRSKCACVYHQPFVRVVYFPLQCGVLCALSVLSGVEPQFLAREGSIVSMSKTMTLTFDPPSHQSRSSSQEETNPPQTSKLVVTPSTGSSCFATLPFPLHVLTASTPALKTSLSVPYALGVNLMRVCSGTFSQGDFSWSSFMK
jgi:hypothetical protein